MTKNGEHYDVQKRLDAVEVGDLIQVTLTNTSSIFAQKLTRYQQRRSGITGRRPLVPLPAERAIGWTCDLQPNVSGSPPLHP